MLDLETNDLPAALAELHTKVAADDPYIQGLRVARNRPGIVRLVLDLKAEVKPQIFTLPPIADYGHRLVLDIHPAGGDRSAGRSCCRKAGKSRPGRPSPASPASPPSSSTPGTAARIRARSAGAARARRTSR